jgi:long-chain fatty acid transport protein
MAAPAWAGGFAVARFGGEHGNPTESNPWSLYYNPGGIGMSEGWNLGIDANFVFRQAEFIRPVNPDALEVEQGANSGTATLDNFLISPAFALTWHLGDDLPLAFGLAFFAPFGGAAVWDEVEASSDFPGAQDGPQRWYAIDGSIRTLSFTGGLAYHLEEANLSVGVSANYYIHQLNTLRARNGDGSDDLDARDTDGNSLGLREGRSWLDAEGTNVGLGFGVLWEASEDELWIGLSYQSQPGFGATELKGTLKNLLAEADETEADVVFRQSLPDVIRFGVRYRPQEDLELRLFGDFTRWSVFDQQCLANSGADLDKQCAVNADGSGQNSETPIQVFNRDWQDTYGVRAGASYWLMDGQFELIGGLGYDSNAVPDETLEPALQDYEKFTLSAGGRYEFTDWVALSLTGTNVFYIARDTTDAETGESLRNPSRQPSSAGKYSQNIFLINSGLELKF